MRTSFSMVLAAVAATTFFAGCTGRTKQMTFFNEERSQETLAVSPSVPAGYRIAPVTDLEVPHYDGDEGPAQLFEILRPENAPVTLGRMYTSCTCIETHVEKKTFGQDERAILTVRHVKPAPAGGATFTVGVKVTSPVDTLLSVDVTVGR